MTALQSPVLLRPGIFNTFSRIPKFQPWITFVFIWSHLQTQHNGKVKPMTLLPIVYIDSLWVWFVCVISCFIWDICTVVYAMETMREVSYSWWYSLYIAALLFTLKVYRYTLYSTVQGTLYIALYLYGNWGIKLKPFLFPCLATKYSY